MHKKMKIHKILFYKILYKKKKKNESEKKRF